MRDFLFIIITSYLSLRCNGEKINRFLLLRNLASFRKKLVWCFFWQEPVLLQFYCAFQVVLIFWLRREYFLRVVCIFTHASIFLLSREKIKIITFPQTTLWIIYSCRPFGRRCCLCCLYNKPATSLARPLLFLLIKVSVSSCILIVSPAWWELFIIKFSRVRQRELKSVPWDVIFCSPVFQRLRNQSKTRQYRRGWMNKTKENTYKDTRTEWRDRQSILCSLEIAPNFPVAQ